MKKSRLFYIAVVIFSAFMLLILCILAINPGSGLSEMIPTYEYSPDLADGSYAKMQVTSAKTLFRTVKFRNPIVLTKDSDPYITVQYTSYILCEDNNGNAVVVGHAQSDIIIDSPTLSETSILRTLHAERYYQSDKELEDLVASSGTAGYTIQFLLTDTSESTDNKDNVWYRWKRGELQTIPTALSEFSQLLNEADPKSDEEFLSALNLATNYPYGEYVTVTPEMEWREKARENRIGVLRAIPLLLGWLAILLFLGKLQEKARAKKQIQLKVKEEKQKQELIQKVVKEKVKRQTQQLEEEKRQAKIRTAETPTQPETEKNLIAKSESSQLKSSEEYEQRDLSARFEVNEKQQKEQELLAEKNLAESQKSEERVTSAAADISGGETSAKEKALKSEALLNKVRALKPTGKDQVLVNGQITLFDALVKVMPELEIMKETGHAAEYLYHETITSGEQMLAVLNHMLAEMDTILDTFDYEGRKTDMNQYSRKALCMALKALDFYNELSGESDAIYLTLLWLIDILTEEA